VLTTQHIQEALSRAYIHAVAARCGMSTATYDFDYGIDLTINEITRKNGKLCPKAYRIDVQAKCTILAQFDSDTIRYDLTADDYNFLCDKDVPTAVPRILVLLVLPQLEIEWMNQDETALTLRQCAYWASFKGKPITENVKTIRVTLSRGNVFSSANLVGIMARIARGEEL
jgi:hypothetical protein